MTDILNAQRYLILGLTRTVLVEGWFVASDPQLSDMQDFVLREIFLINENIAKLLGCNVLSIEEMQVKAATILVEKQMTDTQKKEAENLEVSELEKMFNASAGESNGESSSN